ncbi:hypothetical protein Tco_1448408 [Tanacetum coccineum]
MGDKNPICTLGNYSKPSHEGYRNTTELPEGNNVVPLRFDTIQLVQNGCSFHGFRFRDPNQHRKDFLKLVDTLDLDVANRERTRLHLFQFSLRDQASNCLEQKVLIREEARHPITKNVNSISLIRVEEEKNLENNRAIGKSVVKPSKPKEDKLLKEVDATNEVERRADDKPAKSVRENVTKNEEEEPTGVSSSHAVGYYLNHRFKDKLIEGLVENQKFNYSLSAARVGKMKRKTYNLLPMGPVHDSILKKK